ncbi:hypothetical protein MC885_006224, partial [Smutsia gigantea]
MGFAETKVYVGNLGTGAGKGELERAFSYYGPLRTVWIARNPPGFAFVEFEDPRDAEDAVRGLDGKVICGSRVRVELSTGMPRRSRFDRPPARRPFDPNDRCYECGEKGHYAYDCHRYSRRRRSRSRSRSHSRSRGRRYSRSRSRSRGRRSRSASPRRSRSVSLRRSRSASLRRSRSGSIKGSRAYSKCDLSNLTQIKGKGCSLLSFSSPTSAYLVRWLSWLFKELLLWINWYKFFNNLDPGRGQDQDPGLFHDQEAADQSPDLHLQKEGKLNNLLPNLSSVASAEICLLIAFFAGFELFGELGAIQEVARVELDPRLGGVHFQYPPASSMIDPGDKAKPHN